jgi:hypothetical protein
MSGWEEKNKALRKECKRLRADLARVAAERDMYLKSLYTLTRKTIPLSAKDIQEMETNPKQLDDILKELGDA